MLVFILNAGSSSLKYQLINAKTSELKASGLVERIGIDGILKHEVGENKKLTFELPIPTHKEAIELVLRILTNDETKVINSITEIEAIGHRVVHGGEYFKKSTLITEDVIDKIKKLIPLAPFTNRCGKCAGKTVGSNESSSKVGAIKTVSFSISLIKHGTLSYPSAFVANNFILPSRT